jgi:hypothetical protein
VIKLLLKIKFPVSVVGASRENQRHRPSLSSWRSINNNR